jgi:polyhydroxybutyrate depolymerase
MTAVKHTISLILLVLFSVSCNLFSDDAEPDEVINFLHQERNRFATIHYPTNVQGDQPIPLLLAFHGAGGTGSGFQKQSGLNGLADRFGFIVAYPNATGINWAEGCGCIRPDLDGVDDVGFMAALIDHIAEERPVDLTRVFGFGYSQGGIFAHHLACEKSPLFAGMATFAGPMSRVVSQSCHAESPIDMLFIHGTDDEVLPFIGYENGLATLLSAPASLEFWRDINGCAKTFTSENIVRGSERLTVHSARSCDADARVQLVEWLGGSHTWPGNLIGLNEQVIAFFHLDS